MLDMNKDITETGINNLGGCSEKEFFAVGKTLARIEHGMQWAIGDWYNAIPWEDKEKACKKVGLNPKTAANYGTVCKVIQLSLRSENLTFEHHKILAIQLLSNTQRKNLLEKASKNGWTNGRLKKERDLVLGIEKKQISVPSIDKQMEEVIEALPKQTPAKVKKTINQAYEDLKKRFNQEVEQEVRHRLKQEKTRIAKIESDADQKLKDASRIRAGVLSFMTVNEFKLILGVLHPDKEAPETRKRKAFQIFKRLEETVLKVK